MLGLRTEYDLNFKEFVKFFEVMQSEAEKNGFVFFLNAVDGYDTEFNGMYCDCMMGWLLPVGSEDCERFKKVFENREERDSNYWNRNYYGRVDYEIRNGELIFTFSNDRLDFFP